MKINWLWDSRLTEHQAERILRDEKDPRFDIYAEKLLSRTSDPSLVLELMEETVFCHCWPRLKTRMQKDRWLGERIIFWQTIYERVRERLKVQGVKMRAASKIQIPSVRMDVARQIHALREKMGYTQREMAKKLGVIQQYVSRVERGGENFSVDALKRIADVFGKGLIIRLK